METISRQDAKAQGLKHYFTGEPCKHGHTAKRKVCDRGCVECKKTSKRRCKIRRGLISLVAIQPRLLGPFLSKEQAIKKGLAKYFDGTACNKGHATGKRVCDNNCFECRQEWWQKQYQKLKQNPEFVQASLRRSGDYNKAHPEKYRASATKCTRNRRRNDPAFRLLGVIRSRVHSALKGRGAKKTGRMVELLGCTIPELQIYLANLFLPGMSWDNYGEWHIDHIRPCASFDITDPGQQRVCFHYANLQPLWATENLVKNDTWTREMEAEWIVLMRSHGFTGELFLVFDHELVAA